MSSNKMETGAAVGFTNKYAILFQSVFHSLSLSFFCSFVCLHLSLSSGLDALYDKMLQDRGDVIAVINGERPLSSP